MSVHRLDGGLYQARCSCGWEGDVVDAFHLMTATGQDWRHAESHPGAEISGPLTISYPPGMEPTALRLFDPRDGHPLVDRDHALAVGGERTCRPSWGEGFGDHDGERVAGDRRAAS